MMTRIILMLFLALLCTSISAPNRQALALPIFRLDSELSSFEYQKFLEHTESRLPSYKKYFKKYSDKYDVPWTLIAAVAYQESKWNADAVSYTGVKGLMQLTSKTAEYIGINDRENPYESIRGGTFYLKYLYEKTPQKLSSNQRWVLALSAYNIGWGHLKDAIILARKLKKNPYNWDEFRVVLKKLEATKYYSELTYGYARGKETVNFVEHVFNYYNLLNHTFNRPSTIARFTYKK